MFTLKIKKISLLLLSITFLCSCSVFKKAQPPEKVAKDFFYYFNNFEYDKAKELATENTKKMITFIANLQKLGGGNKLLLSDNKTDLLKTEIIKKEAILTYKTVTGGEQKVYLMKKKGKWLVDLRKEPQNQDSTRVKPN